VACGDLVCEPGQFCVFQIEMCTLIPKPTCPGDPTETSSETGTSTSMETSPVDPEPEYCWSFPDTYRCEPIPTACKLGLEFAGCIEDHFDCNRQNDFADWALTCEDYVFCQFYQDHGYCDPPLDCDY
jgi:hypothetical protein